MNRPRISSHAIVVRTLLVGIVAASSVVPLATSDELEARELTSPGGIVFRHVEMPEEASVSIQVAWPSDWAYTERAVGAPYVGAELLPSGGAGEKGPAEMQQAFEELQAQGGLNVVADHVYGYLDARARDLDAAIELGAPVLNDPALDERWFERIRDGIAANVAESKRESGSRVGDLLRRLTLGDGGIERFLSLEPPEVLTDVTLEDVRRWHERTLVREGMTVAIAGGIDAEAAGEAVDALLGGLPAGEAAPEIPAVDVDLTPRRVVLHDPDIDKSVVALLGWLPPTAEGGELEDILATLVLGGGDGSRLFEALRTELRASYAAQALIDTQSRALRGLLIYAEVDAERLAEARRAVREEYARLRADGPTDEELDAAKTQLAEGLRQMLETPGATARSLVEAALDGQPADRVPSLPAELDAITATSVRARLTEAYPPADELLEAVLTPASDAFEDACVIASLDEAGRCEGPSSPDPE